ncbi:MAG: hypothetical protein MSC55_05455, partial [Faecalibacterium sp.]|nr:hypothetical protein [Faecalibacterium sp.]
GKRFKPVLTCYFKKIKIIFKFCRSTQSYPNKSFPPFIIFAKVACRLSLRNFALAVRLWLAVLYARLLKGRWLFVGFACCHGVSPVSVPLIASQQGIHGKSKGGDTLGLAVGSFSNCVTRFRDGALRHAKFPKTSYCLQLLDTLLHAACVSLNHKRRRGLISRSRKVLAQCCKT